MSWVQRRKPVTSAFRRSWQDDHVWGRPGLYSKPQASLDYIARPCLKKEEKFRTWIPSNSMTTYTDVNDKANQVIYTDVNYKQSQVIKPLYDHCGKPCRLGHLSTTEMRKLRKLNNWSKITEMLPSTNAKKL
jgi:hypothetical protein